MIVGFSGFDGAGKSTQIVLLTRYLEQRGYRVKVIWIRGGYTPIFEFLKSLGRKLRIGIIPKESGPSLSRSRTFNRLAIRNLWLAIAIIELLWIFIVYLRILKLSGKTLVLDRKVMDTVLDWKTYHNYSFDDSFFFRVLQGLSVRIDHNIILNVSLETSIARCIAKGEVIEETAEETTKRWNMYVSTFKDKKYFHIDSEELNAEQIHETVINEVFGFN